MRICIQFLGLTLMLLLLAGCAALPAVGEPPPAPTPTAPVVPGLPAPFPMETYDLDFPPVPVWDFYREWLENPAAAHYKYYGRTVTLVYVRGMVPHPKDGVFLAALQAPKGGPDAERIQDDIRLGTADGSKYDAIEAGWGPWLESYHRPTAGRDFQMRCNPAKHLDGRVNAFFVLERGVVGPDTHFVWGPLFDGIGQPVAEARALWDVDRPLSKWKPQMRMQAEEWNDRVYVVHGRVLGHVVGRVPFGGRNNSSADRRRYELSADGAVNARSRPYLYVEMDHCVFDLMDITASELDAWFDADRELMPDPDDAPYRPITRDDMVLPVAMELTGRIYGSWSANPPSMRSIVGRTGTHYVLQDGPGGFRLFPVSDFTPLRDDAPPLPVITESGNVRITSPGFVGPYPLGLDLLRRNWLFLQEGGCVHLTQGWPECIPATKADWMSNPENRRRWVAAGGD